MIVTVFKEGTKELVACINTDKNSKSLCHEGIRFAVSENEPVFTKYNNALYVVDNMFIMNLD